MLEELIDNAQKLPDYDLSSWKPIFHGDMDLVIGADGTWCHQGSPILKAKIKQLFGRLLQLQDNGDYWIITPVEAFRVTVEDLPFIIVSADFVHKNGLDVWQFTTNMGDQINLCQADQLQVTFNEDQPQPKLYVRDGLWARINRSVFYQLALACDVVESSQGDCAWLTSGHHRYCFGPV